MHEGKVLTLIIWGYSSPEVVNHSVCFFGKKNDQQLKQLHFELKLYIFHA